jgi:hypothetical protein
LLIKKSAIPADLMTDKGNGFHKQVINTYLKGHIMTPPRRLEWAGEIQAQAQTGSSYAQDDLQL